MHEPPLREHGIGFGQAARVWAYVGLNSFGGPAGQIAVMHRVLVDDRRWFGERRFLHALNYCMLLPGPEAQQLATYFGWLLHGVRGGLVAGGLFVLPGFAAILALSVLYAGYGDTAGVEAISYGIKPAVMAIVAFAVVRIGSRALTTRFAFGVAAAAFVAIFFLDVPFPLIVTGAGLLGYLAGRRRPAALPVAAHAARVTTREAAAPLVDDDAARSGRPSTRRALRTLALGLAVWLTPLAVLALALGRDHVFVEEGVLFSTAAVVSFGGAYAVLGYIAQQAVQGYGWLTAGEMLDGLGMAESTPGPLIMVVEYVGFLAAYRSPGELDPLLAGVLGAALVTWVTFAPSFLWIFLGAPYAEYLRGNRHLTAALSAITAAVVGVILNLAVWFSLHALFDQVGERHLLGVRLYDPRWPSFDPVAAGLAALAFYVVFRRRWPLLATLGASAALGAALSLAGAG
ncbi:MAG: chromate efflux transporter [Thermoleophilia bacterium]|nr:chromate efflux transporter [Thermoleophilia bacterium]